MSKLYNQDDQIITTYIEQVLAVYESDRIIHTLLDGTSHVQTIGAPHKVLEIHCVVAEPGKKMLDEAFIQDAPLTIEWDGIYHTGIMNKRPDWRYLLKSRGVTRIYDAKLVLLVNEEAIG